MTREEEEKAAFKEKLRSLAFAFPYGRDQFHGPTIGERKEQQIRESAAAGNAITPVGDTVYTGR